MPHSFQASYEKETIMLYALMHFPAGSAARNSSVLASDS
jgi:hypothetical protein